MLAKMRCKKQVWHCPSSREPQSCLFLFLNKQAKLILTSEEPHKRGIFQKQSQQAIVRLEIFRVPFWSGSLKISSAHTVAHHYKPRERKAKNLLILIPRWVKLCIKVYIFH